MTDAWGGAWGDCWGGSWGATEIVVPVEIPPQDRYRQMAAEVMQLQLLGDANPVMLAIGQRRRTH